MRLDKVSEVLESFRALSHREQAEAVIFTDSEADNPIIETVSNVIITAAAHIAWYEEFNENALGVLARFEPEKCAAVCEKLRKTADFCAKIANISPSGKKLFVWIVPILKVMVRTRDGARFSELKDIEESVEIYLAKERDGLSWSEMEEKYVPGRYSALSSVRSVHSRAKKCISGLLAELNELDRFLSGLADGGGLVTMRTTNAHVQSD